MAEMLPHAEAWDRDETFPVDVMRQAAEMGFGGVYVRDDVGGTSRAHKGQSAKLDALLTTRVYVSVRVIVKWARSLLAVLG